MKKISLDSILLFALVIPFIMGYRLGPGNTPYWLFGVIFLLLVINVGIDLKGLKTEKYDFAKNILVWITAVVVIGSAFVSTIIVRHQTAPTYMIHDIILQQESAIRFLLHGKNPYSTTYFGTPLQQWHYSDTDINPALYHFVMEPFYLFFAIPFYLLSTRTIGFFDGRMPLLFLYFLMLLFAWKIPIEQKKKRLFFILLAFNPSMLPYTLEGRSDIFMFAFMLGSFYFMLKNKLYTSSIFMALAFAVKQSVWPILPFYIFYIWYKTKNIKIFSKTLGLFFVFFGAMVIPFLIWDAKPFIDSTVLYLSGNTAHSYPISGYGFGMVLHQMGIIKDVHSYFSFTFLQIVTCLPLLFFLLKYLKKNLNGGAVLTIYGIFLFVYWYFSRYFNNSHVGYLSLIFIAAYFWPQTGQDKESKNS